MQTTAIQSRSGTTVRGELITRHPDGTATIRFAGSLEMHGKEVTIADMIATARTGAEGGAP